MTTVTTRSTTDRGAGNGPRLVHIAPVVPIFMVALLAAGAIRDNSFLWHIRAGSVQLDRGQVLTADVFSFPEIGSAWRTQSWLVELAYAGLDDTFTSLSWVNWMVFVVGAGTVAFVGVSIYRRVESPVATGLVLIPSVWLLGPFLQPRPVVFSFLMMAMLVVVLENRDRLAWVIVPILWIWASVHGSWVLGGLPVFLWWLRTWDRRLLIAGAIAGFATLATAHGLGTWQIVTEFLGAGETLDRMAEWQPPAFDEIAQAPYLLLIAGITIAAVRGRIALEDLIIVLPFLFFGMTSRRAVPIAAIVLIPWAALALPRIVPSSATMSRWIAATALAIVGMVAVLPMFVRPLGMIDDERFPDRRILAAMGDDRAFHGDAEGGYLIYAAWPDRLVYFDDRAELYPIEHFEEYDDVRNGRYTAGFDRWEIEVALSRREWPLTDALVADGWSIRAENEHFVVFERPER